MKNRPRVNIKKILGIVVLVVLFLFLNQLTIVLSSRIDSFVFLGKEIPADNLNGCITVTQFMICVISIIKFEKTGMIVSNLLLTYGTIGCVISMVQQNSIASLPGFIQNLCHILIVDVIYFYISELHSNERELEERFQMEVERRKGSQHNLLQTLMLNVTKDRLVEVAVKDRIMEYNNEDRTILEELKEFIMISKFSFELGKAERIFTKNYLMQAYIDNEEINEEVCIRKKDGSLIWVNLIVRFSIDPKSKNLIAFVYNYDITMQKITHDIIEATVHYDYETIANVNLCSDKIIYYSDDMVDKSSLDKSISFEEGMESYSQYVHPDDLDLYHEKTSLEVVKKELSYQDIYEFKVRVLQDGQVYIKHIRFANHDKVNGIVLYTRNDITNAVYEEKKQREVLEEALNVAKQANDAKTEFLSNMSHDIRTPMNAIVGMTGLALDEIDNPKQVEENLKIIQTSSNQLLSLINDVLDMSRIERGGMVGSNEVFSHSEQTEQIITQTKILADKKNQKVEYVSHIVHDDCYGDVMRLQRIFTNLIGNAIKFTPEGGTISFRVTEFPYPRSNRYGTYRYEIADTGVGMNEEQVEHIFEPFYRTENSTHSGIEGTGLGLSIVKNILEAMGGTIDVDSEVGKGTTFTVQIDIPIVENVRRSSRNVLATPATIKQLSNARILLVEDNVVNQKVATRILEKTNAKVQIADNGKEAYEIFLKSQPDQFDLILMDIQMPIMNGYDATRAIRSSMHPQAKSIPIIAMTANAFANDVKDCIDAGMNLHLPKPINPNQLFMVLGKFFE